MDLEVIKKEIKAWSNLVESFKKSVKRTNEYVEKGDLILKYLNQGNYYTVTDEEIKNWKATIGDGANASIHVYAALDELNSEFKFYLIDSKNDKKGIFNNTIIEKQFIYTIDGDEGDIDENPIKRFNKSFKKHLASNEELQEDRISIESILIRSFAWSMFSQDWLKEIKTFDMDVFKVIAIPFEDYAAVSLIPGEVCFNFFGLRPNESQPSTDEIEIIVTKQFTMERIISYGEDFSTPRPPFSDEDPESNYQLLIASDGI